MRKLVGAASILFGVTSVLTSHWVGGSLYEHFDVLHSNTRVVAAQMSLQQLALEMVNVDRNRQGLLPLSAHPVLMQVAQLHAEDMLERGYFSHTNPDGALPGYRVEIAGGSFTAVAENIFTKSGPEASASPETVQQFQMGWMDSPGHRTHILSANYTHFGYGIVSSGEQVYGVQLFGQPFTE
ncbi:MAG: CAP domain-containing protein [Cyanobacteria bacterium P01_E01_bin.34]